MSEAAPFLRLPEGLRADPAAMRGYLRADGREVVQVEDLAARLAVAGLAGLDSGLMGFASVVRMAMAAAGDRGLDVSPTTVANVASLEKDSREYPA